MNYIDLATQVLKKIMMYDPRMANPDSGQVKAWAEHLMLNRLDDREDVLHAVTLVFNEDAAADPQFRATPKMISTMARKVSRERYERSALDSPQRRRLEQRGDLKAAPDEDYPALPAAPPRTPAELRSALNQLAAAKALPGPTADAVWAATVAPARRKAAPPAPLACPDCGQTEIPCRCEIAEEAQKKAEQCTSQ